MFYKFLHNCSRLGVGRFGFYIKSIDLLNKYRSRKDINVRGSTVTFSTIVRRVIVKEIIICHQAENASFQNCFQHGIYRSV